jgi:hypothetical protein
MQDDAKALNAGVEAPSENGGPTAEPCEKKAKNYRRLRSLTTNRILHQEKEKPVVQKVFDPTAWYVYGVKRNKEIDACSFLKDPKNIPFEVEAYAAVQQKKVRTYKKGQKSSGSKKLVEKVVIHGKIFIKVDESHRVDTLKLCPLLTHCMVDPTLSRTKEGFRDFARVPDAQMRALKAVLQLADGDVEFSEEVPPQVHETVTLNDGFLSESEALKDLQGTVEMVNGKKRATVILNNIGCFKFTLSIDDLKRPDRSTEVRVRGKQR